MKRILLLGAGGASSALTAYLSEHARRQGWMLDAIGDPDTPASRRKEYIYYADVVISLLPHPFHQTIAEECIAAGKHLLSPLPLNEKIMNLRQQIERKNILFLYELGFDPGLDHMSALQLIHSIQQQDGRIISFQAHCGRLPQTDATDNPWQYKTVNAQALSNAGKDQTVYKENGQVVHSSPSDSFNSARLVDVPGIGFLSWFPHRDSLGYIPLYGLNEAETVMRTTLCHPDFIYGWKNVIDLNLSNDNAIYEIDNMLLGDFFKMHLHKQGFTGWLEQKMIDRLTQTKQILEKLIQFMDVEQQASQDNENFPESLMMVDAQGRLENIDLLEVKDNAAALVAYKMHEANLTLKQLFYLGMDDKQILIPKGRYSASDILQLAIEKKLLFAPGESDTAVMLHEIEYELNGRHTVTRHLVLKNNERSSVDKITGLLLGIATKLILENKLNVQGLHIPIASEIYEPIMMELAEHGIRFTDHHT